MARGINKVILVGNVGNAPEVRQTTEGNAIATLSLATSETWKDKQTGGKQEKTEWHRVVFFNRLAEIAAQYLRKGSKVYIEGSLRTNKYTDKNGVEKYSTEIIANEMQMLDSRGSDSGQYASSSSDRHESQTAAPTHATAAPIASADFDDDIPF